MLKSIKTRLIVMNILQWAVWGSYLTSMANYLGNAGLGEHIGLFFALQGIVSIFMPTIMGIDGILYAGPISDGVAAIIAIVMVRFEFKAMKRLEQNVE